eukprot:CAMPEP_0183485620 /NCGR_PEP_ID=MMETSP0370-20130417/179519_1 /TAXON_ID=268820 /ORGANISM="Peridinium aciculiferum, Strain PAER-2" /LENGTH=411 /DNA_ID=CAMNT_0025678925 /DNA_START=74 /DNA_END=1307 /DNA_ORIENTATION=-
MSQRTMMELGAGVVVGGAVLLAISPSSFSLSGLSMLAVLLLGVGPLLYKGLMHTIEFLASLSRSKKHNKIDGYNNQYDENKSAEDRNKDYTNLVDSYYDLATEFYEWGWGTSFHFADRRKGETFQQSILRHEYFLAGRLGTKKGATLLDCGCGIGGPARNIARFTGANIKAVTINQFQVNRGNTLSIREGLRDQVELIQGDFMKLPFEDNSFDAVYAIESIATLPTALEYFLAGRLGTKKGATLLDCGCGIGGPARNIARFTGANIKAVTINQFQVNRGNTLSIREGLRDQVELIQADFMKLPFEDNSFDAVYAIESTCHAPDRTGVYSEILRVLKPGGIFACYEWCLTDKYDGKNEHHRRIKKDIEVGDGLPDLVHTSVCTKALGDVGFDVLEARDAMQDGHLEGGEAWY